MLYQEPISICLSVQNDSHESFIIGINYLEEILDIMAKTNKLATQLIR